MKAVIAPYVRSPFRFAKKGALARPDTLAARVVSTVGGMTVNRFCGLVREKGRYALATPCIGGGQGIATILERV